MISQPKRNYFVKYTTSEINKMTVFDVFGSQKLISRKI